MVFCDRIKRCLAGHLFYLGEFYFLIKNAASVFNYIHELIYYILQV